LTDVGSEKEKNCSAIKERDTPLLGSQEKGGGANMLTGKARRRPKKKKKKA